MHAESDGEDKKIDTDKQKTETEDVKAIPIDSTRSGVNKRASHVFLRLVKNPPCIAVDMLKDANPDVGRAYGFCESLGIDMSPVTLRLGDEATVETFFMHLRDYMVALEISLNIGKDLKQNVVLAHQDAAIKKAATDYAVSRENDDDRKSKMVLIKNFRIWIQRNHNY